MDSIATVQETYQFIAHTLNCQYIVPKCPYCSKCMCHHKIGCVSGKQ